MMDFFELNLQRMVIIRIAASLWENDTIKKEIQDLWRSKCKPNYEYLQIDDDEEFEGRYEGKWSYITRTHRTYDHLVNVEYRKWCCITKNVWKQFKPGVLPLKLENELIDVIKQMGRRIYGWTKYLRKNFQCNWEEVIDYTEHICWTHYGAVDEVRIIKSYWLNNPKLDVMKVSEIACNNMLKISIMEPYMTGVEESNKREITGTDDDNNRPLCWENQEVNFKIEEFQDILGKFDYLGIVSREFHQNCSRNVKMLTISALKGRFHAVQYFWKTLTEEEKNGTVESIVLMVIESYIRDIYHGNLYECYYYHEEDQLVQICSFFINHMTIVQLEQLFSKLTFSDASGTVIVDYLEILLNWWPWQEFYLPIIYKLWPVLEKQGHSALSLLNLITSFMFDEYKLGYDIMRSKNRMMLHDVCASIPICLKKMFNHINISFLMGTLLKMGDMESIKMIVNGKNRLDISQDLIKSCKVRSERLAQEDKYGILNDFMNEILVSEEERKKFKEQVDIELLWPEFLQDPCYCRLDDFCFIHHEDDYSARNRPRQTNFKPRYEPLDKLLDWKSDSLEERKQIKSKIDAKRACLYFIDHGWFELADEFLNWRFESEEEISDLKNSLKSDYFSRKLIYMIWFKSENNDETAKKESDIFLNWFLKSEREIEDFKKEVLNDPPNFCNVYLMEESRNFDYFLEWCSLSEEETKCLKKRIVDKETLT